MSKKEKTPKQTQEINSLNLFYYLSSAINEDSVKEIVNDYNEGIKSGVDSYTIYIDSVGGGLAEAHLLADFFNQIGATVVACDRLFSAAFDLFFLSKKCCRKILPTACGMIHYPMITWAHNHLGCPYSDHDKFMKRNLNSIYYFSMVEMYKEIGLDKKIYKKNKEVFFTAKQLQEFLDHQEKQISS